jgi:prevent-host-death family protein
LGKYLRRVKAGETIVVTERGKTIGYIIPIRRMQADSEIAEWNGEKYQPGSPVVRNRGSKLLSDVVIENRGDL